MPEKVLNPQKQVTDPVLLSVLAKQGVDPSFVEFFQDYALRSLGKEHSPYAKFYRDLKSNKRFMVVSGLPMVDASGVKVETGWRIAGINYFSEKNNLFRAKVQDTQIEITIRNDQPDGRKVGDKLSYKPQLFLDGIEQSCGQPILLPVDPLNPNYSGNTLEWDYGICKRRLRIIEGRLLGSWVFGSNPQGKILIKYNQTGDFKLKLGQFAINDDEELIESEDFDQIAERFGGYPVTISDSMTFYPDAHVEVSSVDGITRHLQAAQTWATIQGGAGTDVWDTDEGITFGDSNCPVGLLAAGVLSAKWDYFYRSIFLFDVSGLTDSAVISAATMSLYGTNKLDSLVASPTVNIFSSAPASNTALAAGDYDSLGTTPLATAISYANWIYASPYWNDFTFNAAGIAAVQAAADANTVVKLGGREATYDAPNSPAPWVTNSLSRFCCYFVDKGNGYKPKLVVTYNIVPTAWELYLSDSIGLVDAIGKGVGLSKSDSLSLADALAKLSSLAKADSVSLADAVVKDVSLEKSDSLSLADALVKDMSLSKADTLSLADSLSKSISLVKADTLTLSDVLTETLTRGIYHTFFNKTLRKRIIFPNAVTVESQVSPYYGAQATDAESYASLPSGQYIAANVASTAQASAIAKANIKRYQIEQEQGSGVVPMDVYRELYDWIKITDTREADYRIGTVGYMVRIYQPGVFNLAFGFGKNIPLRGMIPTPGADPNAGLVTYAGLIEYNKELKKDIKEAFETFYIFLMNSSDFWALDVFKFLRIPSGTDKYASAPRYLWNEGDNLCYTTSAGVKKTLTGT